jgi:hypothetical protein
MTTYNATQRRRTRLNGSTYSRRKISHARTSTQAKNGAPSNDISGRVVPKHGQVGLATRRLRRLAMLGITARAGTNRGRLRGTRRGDVVLVGRRRQLLLRASLAELGLCKRGENVRCSDAAVQRYVRHLKGENRWKRRSPGDFVGVRLLPEAARRNQSRIRDTQGCMNGEGDAYHDHALESETYPWPCCGTPPPPIRS